MTKKRKTDEPDRYKRAGDMIIPPPSEAACTHSCSKFGGPGLLRPFADEARTGCVKTWNDRLRSRGIIMFYRGRVVGCVYSSHSQPEMESTEPSLKKTIAQLKEPDTLLLMYDLPEEHVLPMATLFIGRPLKRNDKFDSPNYFEFMNHVLKGQNRIASCCLSTTEPSTTLIVFYSQGKFTGTFYVDKQKVSKSLTVFRRLVREAKTTHVEVSVMPQEMLESGEPLGFALPV